MKKFFEIFEIGNRIWKGQLVISIDKVGHPVYKYFYGLSEESVKDQITGYKRGNKTARSRNPVKERSPK